MLLNLAKGERLDITKGTGVKKINIALGWDAETAPGKPTCDLDASAICRAANGKPIGADHVLYFKSEKNVDGKPSILNGALVHSGDELTGGVPGDDEVITLDLSNVPITVETISVVVNIYDAETKKQNFGLVKSAFVRIDNATDNATLGKYDLSEDYSKFRAIHIGDVYRHDGEWRFKALAEGKNHSSINDFYTEWSA